MHRISLPFCVPETYIRGPFPLVDNVRGKTRRRGKHIFIIQRQTRLGWKNEQERARKCLPGLRTVAGTSESLRDTRVTHLERVI